MGSFACYREKAIRHAHMTRKPSYCRRGAVLFSIIRAARANGKGPYGYLNKLFGELPTDRSVTEILRLAPFRSDDP
jgi:hypothetical protein